MSRLDNLRQISLGRESLDIRALSLENYPNSKKYLNNLITSRESASVLLLKANNQLQGLDEDQFSLECITSSVLEEAETLNELDILRNSKNTEAQNIYYSITNEMGLEAGTVGTKMKNIGSSIANGIKQIFIKLKEIISNIIAAITKFVQRLMAGNHEGLISQQSSIKGALKNKTVSTKTIKVPKAAGPKKFIDCKPSFFTSGISDLNKGVVEANKIVTGKINKTAQAAALFAATVVGAAGGAIGSQLLHNKLKNRKQATTTMPSTNSSAGRQVYNADAEVVNSVPYRKQPNRFVKGIKKGAHFVGDNPAFFAGLAGGAAVVQVLGRHYSGGYNKLNSMVKNGKGNAAKFLVYGTGSPKAQTLSLSTIINSVSFEVLSNKFLQQITTACKALEGSIANCNKAINAVNKNANNTKVAKEFSSIQKDIQFISGISKDILVEGLYVRKTLAQACKLALSSAKVKKVK